jgi:hypothetical protein
MQCVPVGLVIVHTWHSKLLQVVADVHCGMSGCKMHDCPTVTVYAFYAFYVGGDYCPQSGALAEFTSS